MSGQDVASVQLRLGLSEQFRIWLDRIDAPDQSDGPDLPDDAEADAMLQRLGVRSQDRVACLGGRPDPERHPDLWWILRRTYQELVAKMGRNLASSGYSGWPALPDNRTPFVYGNMRSQQSFGLEDSGVGAESRKCAT